MKPLHPLERNEQEQAYFQQINKRSMGLGAAAYRRAVIACTGSLPSWCQRRKPGPKPKAYDIE
jgi:hypothetical protein